jgi:hypothetical protein
MKNKDNLKTLGRKVQYENQKNKSRINFWRKVGRT